MEISVEQSNGRWSLGYMWAISETFNILHSMGCVKEIIFGSFLDIHGTCNSRVWGDYAYQCLLIINTSKLFHDLTSSSKYLISDIYLVLEISFVYWYLWCHLLLSFLFVFSLLVWFNLLNFLVLGTEFEECVPPPVENSCF